MNTLQLQSSRFGEIRTYIAAAVFVLGNMVLPQLCHLIPQGGMIFLPIYFFTLIGAYLYGWRVGLLTAILSPVVNRIAFGMPAEAALPAILVKSVLLAVVASAAARRYGKATLTVLVGIVFAYQALGTLAEWALIGEFSAAVSDFTLGLPGMLIQIFGAYLLLKHAN